MPSKMSASKEVIESNTDEAVKIPSSSVPILIGTQLYIENGSNITWNTVTDAFKTI